ncbi:hypothetical protein CSTERLE_06290 [Thermoclostridium stercorarium subsp. leptospartum DSM 9219]|uniref:Uncharacterized protein n=1 Tax=Thermoclostridium stercorarium subsp. leptospartum DSM 9219 TaxID=1346611 RepID=A0A1B1YKA6_THEST|nr:hypothetical protein [Thermoclostridium stercorarium]ANX01205.1 hypothetical protein CSTERLE_06290 [Thermoclostridium stercorarium subsp. leptospartum DSM 9219]
MSNKKNLVAKAVLITAFSLAALCTFCIIQVNAIEVVGTDTGLRVELSGNPVPTGNLTPGDTKTSMMTISIEPESGASSLRVWIRSEIVESIPGKDVNGIIGNLDDRLILTVTHEDGRVLHNGPISKFNENILVGDIRKGEPVDLTFTVHLPGETTGNEYQGASLKVRWILTAQYDRRPSDTPTVPPISPTIKPPSQSVTPVPSQPPPDEAGEQNQPDISQETPETVEIEDEEIPASFGEPDGYDNDEPGNDANETEIIIIEDGEIPKGLPKTGELPPIVFFGVGACIIYAGIRLNRNKAKQ